MRACWSPENHLSDRKWKAVRVNIEIKDFGNMATGPGSFWFRECGRDLNEYEQAYNKCGGLLLLQAIFDWTSEYLQNYWGQSKKWKENCWLPRAKETRRVSVYFTALVLGLTSKGWRKLVIAVKSSSWHLAGFGKAKMILISALSVSVLLSFTSL